jgi:hypothetical protein
MLTLGIGHTAAFSADNDGYGGPGNILIGADWGAHGGRTIQMYVGNTKIVTVDASSMSVKVLNVSDGPFTIPQLSTTALASATPTKLGQLVQTNSTGQYKVYIGTDTGHAGSWRRVGPDPQIQVTLNDGTGSALATGNKQAYVRVSNDVLLTSWELAGYPSGSVTVDIYRSTAPLSTFPPTSSICGASEKPAMSSVVYSSGTFTSAGGSTLLLSQGDWLEFNVTAATTTQKAILVLKGQNR